MMDKVGRFIKRLFRGFLFVCLVIYLLIAYFYRDVFQLNTWINGVYCTGKSVEEVNTELLFQTEAPFLTIIGMNGETVQINMAEASYRADYSTSLQNYIGKHCLLWPLALGHKQNISLEPVETWDDEKLKAVLLSLDMVKQEMEQEAGVRLVMGENGYELLDATKQVFHPEVFTDYVIHNLKMGMYSASMADSGAFVDMEYTTEQLDTLALWEKLQDFQKCDIVYDMGTEQIPLSGAITSRFVQTDGQGSVVLDENGQVALNEAGIVDFVEELAERYDTCGTTLSFEATRGEVVEIPYENYGTKLDTEAEIAYLTEAFSYGFREVHVPAYVQQGYVRGLDDIGDTYIEIDMTAQKLYAYKEGELLLETDIVTGNMKKGWDTPDGVNQVYAKQKNRTLRGANYASHVDYWMPVNGNIGLHDANWRRSFGGEIYLKNGSHGCVNIPSKIMPTIYKEYEVGTPVIMFY